MHHGLSDALWRPFASLRNHRNYRLFFCGQLISVCGMWMQDTALPWLVLKETDSALAVAALVTCRFAPFFVLGLHAGVVADRRDNRRMVIITNTASMLIAVALVFVTSVGRPSLAAIYLLAVAGGIALTYEAPNRHAFMYQLVTRKELPNAISLNAGLGNAARAVGPALAGVIIATLGVQWCFAFNAASFAAVITAFLLMRTADLFHVDRYSETGIRRAIASGFIYMRQSRLILGVMGILLAVSAFGFNFRVLIPVFATDTLAAGAKGFGLLSAAFGAGALAGSLAVAALGRATWRLLIIGSLVFNGAVTGLALVRHPMPAALVIAVAGAGFAAWLAMGQSIIQLTTPDHLRGRVLSVYLLLLGGLQPLGGLVGGLIADAAGIPAALAIGGIVGLLATAAASLWIRQTLPGGSSVAPPSTAVEVALAEEPSP